MERSKGGSTRAADRPTAGGKAAGAPVHRGDGAPEGPDAEDAWNTRDPEKVAQAYTEDSQWRNRDEFFEAREEIVAFLMRKWERELDYRLRKEL